MRILVLGGTRYLGRHLVEAALARGHVVTTFTRGRLPNHWPGRVTGLLGDRDPRLAPGLAALESGRDAMGGTRGMFGVLGLAMMFIRSPVRSWPYSSLWIRWVAR